MKRNPFEALVRVRSIRERQARAELGRARGAQAEALAQLEEYRARFAGSPEPPAVLTPLQLHALHLTGVRGQELLEEAAAAVERARRHAEKQAQRWREAEGERAAAEKLARRRREEAMRAARAAAERALDDLFLVLRGRRR